MSEPTMLKVGELATRTGLTVRTLHHWDALGLLRAAERTPAGYRLYGPDELERLQQILSLRQLGMSLDEIGRCLGDDEFPPQRILALHLARLRQQARTVKRLVGRLQRLMRHYEGTKRVTTDRLLDDLKEMTMWEKYYTQDQLETLARRRETVGEETIDDVQRRWAEITTEVRAAMDSGVEPEDPGVAPVARRWRELTRETVAGFTGGDAGLAASAARVWTEEPGVGDRWGMSAELRDWIGRAVAALGDGEQA